MHTLSEISTTPLAPYSQARCSPTSGAFLISLDFELRWGTRDQDTPLGAPQLLNSRYVVSRLLELFEKRGVAATWATVGFLFAESREEWRHYAPRQSPTYDKDQLNPYREVVGLDEKDDPLHFAPSLIRAIGACPRQEMASHTFSHYYCLEPGQTTAQFEDDIRSACRIAQAREIKLRSIVFPRNQVNAAHLACLSANGIHCYRGTARSWVHDAADFASQRLPHKRALRLADAYFPLLGNDVVDWPVEVLNGVYESSASRYFRPYTAGLSLLANQALNRIRSGMKLAAQSGRVYHLWFHPEDFGLYPEENLAMFDDVLQFYCELRDRYGMRSLSMAESVSAAPQLSREAARSIACLR